MKILIFVLSVAFLLSLPYMLTFASGNEASNATGLEKAMGTFSIGNIGQSKDMCSVQDINNCDTIDI